MSLSLDCIVYSSCYRIAEFQIGVMQCRKKVKQVKIMIMQKDELNNVNISDEQILITPKKLKKYYPLDHNNQQIISQSRRIIADIIQHSDPRLLVIYGPYSIHDVDVALEYAHCLKQLAIKLSDSLYIAMRVYFEKLRTSTGWKGLISDPMMDGSFDMEKGLHIARKLLLSLVDMGLPLATETLDPNSPQYLGDLFSWSAIGARTTESQTHPRVSHRHIKFQKWLQDSPCRLVLKMVLVVI